tara:strand:+ start:684 stop:932 length:249 start_codon:yes stop_codon:yes gene_type:complete
MITFLILEISSTLETQAEHKNSLINKFCIASLKSKLKLKDKKEANEISHFTCECFLKKYKSGSSIKTSKAYCKNIAAEKYGL